MRFYPRFLRKELRDEFICDLAPEKELLREFNAAQRQLADHNSSFAKVDYERRFALSDKALARLEELAQLSKTKHVYLCCICSYGDRCHREMLMLLAQALFGCTIGKVFHSYPDYMQRLPETAKQLKALRD